MPLTPLRCVRGSDLQLHKDQRPMSTYDPSVYDPSHPARRPVSSVWPLLVLLLGLALLLGGLVYWFWPGHQPSGLAQPRAVTPAGDLGSDEKATIQLFKGASPSVV